MDTLPDEELRRFLDCVDGAVRQAHHGQVTAGFLRLYAGWEQAEALTDEGEEWGPDLARRYREAADHYARRFGEALLTA